MYSIVVTVTAIITANFLITSGTKCLLALTGQHNNANLLIMSGIVKRLQHLLDSVRTKSITHFGAVDGDPGNAIGRFGIADIAKIHTAVVPYSGGVKHRLFGVEHFHSLNINNLMRQNCGKS